MKSLSSKHLVLVTLMAFLVVVGAQQLFAAGKPWIGIYMQDVTPDLADAFDLSVSKGVVINDVADKSPADKAGLKPKDVVLTWNGKTVADSEELTELVGNQQCRRQCQAVCQSRRQEHRSQSAGRRTQRIRLFLPR